MALDIKVKLNSADAARMAKLFAKLGAAFGSMSNAAITAGDAFKEYMASLPDVAEEDE